MTTGLQYENLIFTVSANYTWAVTNETESEVNALVLLGMVGYDFGDIGRSWTLTGMGGLNGTRKQLMAQLGYRW